eukprot:scaffold3122_cov140-Amphora_coffeaeformis.AAC.2
MVGVVGDDSVRKAKIYYILSNVTFQNRRRCDRSYVVELSPPSFINESRLDKAFRLPDNAT